MAGHVFKFTLEDETGSVKVNVPLEGFKGRSVVQDGSIVRVICLPKRIDSDAVIGLKVFELGDPKWVFECF